MREELIRAVGLDQTVLLSMNHTALAERMAVLVVSVRAGDRSLPLTWIEGAGAA